MKLALLLASIGLGLLTIAMIQHRATNAGLPLAASVASPATPTGARRADYESCATVRTPPLLRSPEGKADYRLGAPFNDKGIS